MVTPLFASFYGTRGGGGRGGPFTPEYRTNYISVCYINKCIPSPHLFQHIPLWVLKWFISIKHDQYESISG